MTNKIVHCIEYIKNFFPNKQTISILMEILFNILFKLLFLNKSSNIFDVKFNSTFFINLFSDFMHYTSYNDDEHITE